MAVPPVIMAGGLLFGGFAQAAAAPGTEAAPAPAAATVGPAAITVAAACPVKPNDARLERACAEAAAYLEALRGASARLRQRRDVALSLDAPETQAALAAALYTPVLRPAGAGRVEVTLAPRPDEEARLAAWLRQPQALDVYRRLLRDYAAALALVCAPAPAARGGAWYRARAVLPTSAPPGADAAPSADGGRDAEGLAGRLEAVSAALAALRPDAAVWLARPESLNALERAAARLPQSAAVLLLLGEVQLQRDLPQQSIGACTAALRLAPELNYARFVRALAHWRLQQLALAEDDLSAALASWHGRAPQGAERARMLRARGAVRQLRRHATGMCADFAAACALGDCEGLAAARAQGQCLKAAAAQPPDTALPPPEKAAPPAKPDAKPAPQRSPAEADGAVLPQEISGPAASQATRPSGGKGRQP